MKKVLVSGLVLILLVVVFLFFYPGIVLKNLKTNKIHESVNYSLSERRVHNSQQENDTKEYYFMDLTFKTPWGAALKVEDDLKNEQINSSYDLLEQYALKFRPMLESRQTFPADAVKLSFDKGETVIVYYDGLSLIEALENDYPKQYSFFERLYLEKYGEEPTDYGLHKMFYESEIENIEVFDSKSDAYGKFIFRNIRVLISPFMEETKNAFSFDKGDSRGFQLESVDGKHFILVFDENDKRYDISLTGGEVSQEDVDYILSSISFK